MTTLRVLDLETTGLKPPEAEVIEFAFKDLVLKSRKEVVFEATPVNSFLFNSKTPCPPELMAVHHLTPEDLEGYKYFNPIEEKLLIDKVFGPAEVYVAHNCEFERLFLPTWDNAPWVCTYKSALRVWPQAPSHSNQALMYWLDGHKELDQARRQPAHRAGPDTYVTAWLLLQLLKVTTLESLIQWTTEPRLLPRCPIGKFKGKVWADVDHGFLDWMLKQVDMDPDLKWNAKRELDHRAGLVKERL